MSVKALHALAQDFRYKVQSLPAKSHSRLEHSEEAKKVGAIIISELYLPDDKKSIRPVTSAMGGIAGGEKFIRNNVLYKVISLLRLLVFLSVCLLILLYPPVCLSCPVYLSVCLSLCLSVCLSVCPSI